MTKIKVSFPQAAMRGRESDRDVAGKVEILMFS